MKTPAERIDRAQRDIEAQQEWRDFVEAVHKPQAAILTFSGEALMLIHLALGKDALR